MRPIRKQAGGPARHDPALPRLGTGGWRYSCALDNRMRYGVEPGKRFIDKELLLRLARVRDCAAARAATPARRPNTETPARR